MNSKNRLTSVVVILLVVTIATLGYANARGGLERAFKPPSAQISDFSQYGKSPYFDGKVRDDQFEKKQFTDDGVVIVSLHDQEVYHPVNAAWFILKMQDSYELTADYKYLEYAEINTKYLLDGAERTKTGTWFTYHFEHSPGGLDNGVPWVSGMAQGMLLSVLSRMYEMTGDEFYKEEADAVFDTFLAPKSTADYWFVNHDGCDWLGQCLFLEEYPSYDDSQNAHVVNGFIYAIWGLYDYVRVFQNTQALQLFNASVTTLEKSFDKFRSPGEASWYAMTEFGHATWKRPPKYHIGVTHQLAVTSEITGSQKLAKQAELLKRDCSTDPCETKP
ncbi:MAG: D-glucuronyl C5-epimerase family protein [Acidobacteriota bacterium]|nr:D-glucuronyl C5-epimerase family protein [Acidobacteriota bacterium]